MLARKNCHRVGVLILFMCALVIASCGKNGDTPKPIDDPKPAPPGPTPPGPTTPKTPMTVDLSKEKPAETYTAKVFREEMIKDSNFPVSKHAGKVVEVTGVVQQFGIGPNAGSLLLVVGPNAQFDTMAFKVEDSHPWTKVLPSQSVALRMRTPSSANDPFVWQITEVKGPSPTAFTAEQFVKEWNANEEAFKKKYANAPVIVTGTVAEVKASDGGGTELQLTAGTAKKLLCTFPNPGFAVAPLTATQKSALKSGVKVKLYGEFTGDRLAMCILLEPAP